MTQGASNTYGLTGLVWQSSEKVTVDSKGDSIYNSTINKDKFNKLASQVIENTQREATEGKDSYLDDFCASEEGSEGSIQFS